MDALSEGVTSMNCGGFRISAQALERSDKRQMSREGQWPGRAQAALVQVQGWAGRGGHTYPAGGAGGCGLFLRLPVVVSAFLGVGAGD